MRVLETVTQTDAKYHIGTAWHNYMAKCFLMNVTRLGCWFLLDQVLCSKFFSFSNAYVPEQSCHCNYSRHFLTSM